MKFHKVLILTLSEHCSEQHDFRLTHRSSSVRHNIQLYAYVEYTDHARSIPSINKYILIITFHYQISISSDFVE